MPSSRTVADLFGLSAERRLQFPADAQSDVLQPLTPATLSELERLDLLPLGAYLVKGHASCNDFDEGIRKRLEAELARERARSVRIAAGLEKALAALARAGIPVILLKGADLGFHAYPAPGLRRMLDVDLLVPLGRLEDASSALLKIGLRENISCYSRDWYVSCLQQLPPLEDETGFDHFDVHGALWPRYSPFAPREPLVWSNTLPSAWPEARRLSREWMVWHLVLHAHVRHLEVSGARERLHVDLLALMANTEREPIDWSAIVQLAVETGTAFAMARAVGRLARAPGVDALTPVAVRLAASKRMHSTRERRLRIIHRLRHLAPFMGLETPAPPDVWIQFVRRSWRVLTAWLRPGL